MKIGDQPDNCICYVCDCVFSKVKSAKVLLYDNDGDIQCLCGDDDHIGEKPKIICLDHALNHFKKHIDRIKEMVSGHFARIEDDGTFGIYPNRDNLF